MDGGTFKGIMLPRGWLAAFHPSANPMAQYIQAFACSSDCVEAAKERMKTYHRVEAERYCAEIDAAKLERVK